MYCLVLSTGWEVKPHSELLNSRLSAKIPCGRYPAGPQSTTTPPQLDQIFAKKNKALFLEQKAVLNVCCHPVAGMWIFCQMTDSRKSVLISHLTPLP